MLGGGERIRGERGEGSREGKGIGWGGDKEEVRARECRGGERERVEKGGGIGWGKEG